MERVFWADQQFHCTLFHVPGPERFGPWTRRRWEVMRDRVSGAVKQEVFGVSSFVCVVELENGALTVASLERLAAAGVGVGAMPTLEATLPGRTHTEA